MLKKVYLKNLFVSIVVKLNPGEYYGKNQLFPKWK
jgi:hypothetical protein